jgi:hypothetical protein
MKFLIIYNTILGGFYVQSDQFDDAMKSARESVGDIVWKKGFSGKDRDGATVAANKAISQSGIEPVLFEGQLTAIHYTQNRDASGNLYPKLRVGVRSGEDDLMLSLDIKSDVAQRLIVKLYHSLPSEFVRISAWPTFVERNGRRFVNHAASVKNFDAQELPINPKIPEKIKEQIQQLESTMISAGLASDKRMLATAKTNKRIELHKKLLQVIEGRFAACDAPA